MPRPLEITLLYNKANHFGLKVDAEWIQKTLQKAKEGIRVREVDPLEPPVPCDILIHLEVPIYGWMPWATTNVLMVNPEWLEVDAWSAYFLFFDVFIFKEELAKRRFTERFATMAERCCVVPWAAPLVASERRNPQSENHEDGFIWFLGASQNKREAARHILPLWRSSYPPLQVYTTKALDALPVLSANVKIHIGEQDQETRNRLGAFYPAHVGLSSGEGFGYAAAEGEGQGAFLLLNDLDVYRADYSASASDPASSSDQAGIGWIQTPKKQKGIASLADFGASTAEGLQSQLDSAVEAFRKTDLVAHRKEQKKLAASRRAAFQNAFLAGPWARAIAVATQRMDLKPKHLPPILRQEDCPPISVITLIYNRRKFFDLACHNIMLSDYPKDKIEWVIVEDSDDPNEDASDRIVQVGLKAAPLQLVYVPLDKKTPIGEKRNIGIRRAKHDILLMMDDDDHYPETSFRRRVAWLTLFPTRPRAVACTTIACYDLIRGVSAVNTPPWSLPFRQRISEATMCFYRGFWEEKGFPAGTQIGEGEGFLEGREGDVLELPPQQIIVALSHQKNTSGRRIPAPDAKPGCFWGFPKEFLIFLHRLAGVEVEEEAEGGRRGH